MYKNYVIHYVSKALYDAIVNSRYCPQAYFCYSCTRRLQKKKNDQATLSSHTKAATYHLKKHKLARPLILKEGYVVLDTPLRNLIIIRI